MTEVAVGAIIAGLSLAYGVTSGEQQRRQQKAGRSRQKQAQDQSLAQAASQQREGQVAQAAQNAKQPDIAAILAASQRKPTGAGQAGAVNPASLLLNGTSLLGG